MTHPTFLYFQNVALSLILILSAAHAAKDKPIELKETKPPIPNRETIQGMSRFWLMVSYCDQWMSVVHRVSSTYA